MRIGRGSWRTGAPAPAPAFRLDNPRGGTDVAPVMTQPAPVLCPMCESPLTGEAQPSPLTPESHPYRPFCSRRCKLLDLSRWLSEEYRVPGDPAGDGGVRRLDEEEETF